MHRVHVDAESGCQRAVERAPRRRLVVRDVVESRHGTRDDGVNAAHEIIDVHQIADARTVTDEVRAAANEIVRRTEHPRRARSPDQARSQHDDREMSVRHPLAEEVLGEALLTRIWHPVVESRRCVVGQIGPLDLPVHRGRAEMHQHSRAGRDGRRVDVLRRADDLGWISCREIHHRVASVERAFERLGAHRVADTVRDAEIRVPRDALVRANDRHDVRTSSEDGHLEQSRSDEPAGADHRYAAADRCTLQWRCCVCACSSGVSHGIRSGSGCR